MCTGPVGKVVRTAPSVNIIFYYFRISQLCKDYCGILNEESLRLNFILVYEILDEVLVSQLMKHVNHNKMSLYRTLGIHSKQTLRC